MLIDYLAIKKVCIAEAGYDPDPLMWNSISEYSKKKVQKILSDIQARYAGNPPLIEHEITNLIVSSAAEGPRGKRKAFLLLAIAKKQGLINQAAEKVIMDKMNLPQKPSQDNAAISNGPHGTVPPKQDIFDMLAGKPTTPTPSLAQPIRQQQPQVQASKK